MMKTYNSVSPADAKITGGFWKEKQRMLTDLTEPHIWKALNNEIEGIIPSNSVENFEIAAGLRNSEFKGLVSQDSDLFKWLEAASFAYNCTGDPDLKRRIDSTVDLLEKAQQKDGYLNTYYILNGLKNKWGYLKESCQLYCAGHLIEAGVTNYLVTKDEKLLKIVCDYADCIERAFGRGEGRIHGYDGHAEIELALLRLYEITGNEKYRNLAEDFIEMRGTKPFYFDLEQRDKSVSGNLVYELKEADYRHSQSHMPVREQKEAVGHAVKAMYFYTSVAMLARINGDEELFSVVNRLWKSTTEQKMYITGAIGACSKGESFSYPYDLPSDLIYGETCASIALFILSFHLLRISNDSRYADVMERALYNGILCGISEDGRKFFYTNPLDFDPEKCSRRSEYSHFETERQPWFECPCCPPNITRLLLSLGQYLYTYDENSVNVHHYAGSDVNAGGTRIVQKTGYPADGNVELTVFPAAAVETLRLRVPFWCGKYELFLNGQELHPRIENGYLVLNIGGMKECRILFKMEMEARKMHAVSSVNGLQGKAAVMYGPLVYCAEEADNGNLDCLFMDRRGKPETVHEQEGKLPDIKTEAFAYSLVSDSLYTDSEPEISPEELLLIPYFMWNNRGAGKMKVFLPEM